MINANNSQLICRYVPSMQMFVFQHILTHLPLDKMATVSQTIFSDAFSWMKMFEFWLKFHWSLFPSVQLTISQHSGLDTNGCPFGNSKFILLSDNLNVCLWLSACQVEKIIQLNNSLSTIESTGSYFRKVQTHLPCSALVLANSICFIYAL